jgi:hypothetical protein
MKIILKSCLFSLIFFTSLCLGFKDEKHWWQKYDLNKTAVIKVPVSDLTNKNLIPYLKEKNYFGKKELNGINLTNSDNSAIIDPIIPSQENITEKNLFEQNQIATKVDLQNFHLPISPETNSPVSRNHQTIFNEIIFDVKDLDENFCSGKIGNIWHDFDDNKKTPLQEDVIFKKDIILLSDILKSGVSLDIIPPPIFDEDQAEVVTLLLPWEDEISKQKYSAGTRFVHMSHFDSEDKFCVIICDNNIKKLISFVPKNLTVNFLIINSKTFQQDKRKLFVQILKTWLPTNKTEDKIIPYVWGGASLVDLYDDKFELVEEKLLDQKLMIYKRKEKPEIFTGFDCSGLILRAAQIAGIKYMYRYTGLLPKFLKPLTKNQEVIDGDLIWISGHVFAVSDTKNNLLIESTGYKSNYGKLHQISLKDRFKDINNYEELLISFFQKKELTLLSKEKEETTYKEFKILRINIDN